jgi:hypothetical protein
MRKVLIRLDLSAYSVDELFRLRSLRILSRDEIMEEMRERGIREWEIVERTRSAA